MTTQALSMPVDVTPSASISLGDPVFSAETDFARFSEIRWVDPLK